MKLISFPPRTTLRPPQCPHKGWFRRRLRSYAFSVFLLRSALEVGLQ